MFEFLYIKDVLEILFFSAVVYFVSLFLKRDKRHNLLIYFYSYCILVCAASLFHLPAITSFLLCASPLIVILFVIFHQELLQKNFVTLRIASSLVPEASDWLENLIRVSLHAINNNKQLICVIEHQADLKPFLHSPFLFDSPLQQNLLILLIESNGFDQNKLIWCTSTGKLIGINSSWDIQYDGWQSQAVKELPIWQQDALLMTLKTDTIVFKADPIKRSFDIVVKGILHENMSAHHALDCIKKQISSPVHKGDIINDNATKKSSLEQQNH